MAQFSQKPTKKSIIGLASPLHGFFKNAFNGLKTICESAFDVGELIPFRLEKNNVIHTFKKLQNYVQIKSALLSKKIAIPEWGANLYPFAAITGASLAAPKVAAKGYEGSFLETMYNRNKDEADMAIAAAAARGDGVPIDAVMFYHQIDITNKKELNKGRGDPLRPGNDRAANSVYAKISGQYLVQQVCSLDSNGDVVIDKDKRGGSIIRPVGRTKNRYMCKLVKLTSLDVSNACGIQDIDSCVRFITSIKSSLMSDHKGDTPFGNPNYGNFEGYFKTRDCITDEGKVDVDKYIQLIKTGKVYPREFVEQMLMKYWMLSDPDKTYVWVSLSNPRAKPFTDNDIHVAKKLLGWETEKNESVGESAVNEAGVVGLTDDSGNIAGADWAESFMKAMISSKQQSNKTVLTFCTVGNSKKVVKISAANIKRLKEIASSYGNVNIKREFIVIDSVLEDAMELDYRPIFNDERFKSMFSPEADRVFTCKRISGYVFGFPFNTEIEEKRLKTIETTGKVNNTRFYEDYLEGYDMNEKNSTGFFVTLVCPKGRGNEINNYFLFTGYDASDNPKTSEYGDPIEGIESLIPSDDNNLLSVIWYNDPSQKSIGKVEMPTNAKAFKTDAAGNTIGYKNRETIGSRSNI